MQKVLVENNADGTTLITINRPERRNAICNETALALQKAFVEFERSTTQRAAVLTLLGLAVSPFIRAILNGVPPS